MQESIELIQAFLRSRRTGISPRTLEFYRGYLTRARSVIGLRVKPQNIRVFLDGLSCSNGGKHAYYRVLRAFYNWAYSPRSGYGLKSQDNPMLGIEPPKVERRILPSLTPQLVNYLIQEAESIRDRAVISLFADSGLRLVELASIEVSNIDWRPRLIRVWCKGGKQGLAPFGEKTESLLQEWLRLSQRLPGDNLFGMTPRQIQLMLARLEARTEIPCNPHVFRRTLACVLAKRGVDSLHIMRLGRWESISMVETYTRSVRFEDSLRFYSAVVKSDGGTE